MKWIFKNDHLFLFLLHTSTLLISLVELWIRGYSELTLTFLVVGLLSLVFCFIGWKTKLYPFFLLSSILFITLSILMIGFPNYISFSTLIFSCISLLTGSFLFVRHLVLKKKLSE